MLTRSSCGHARPLHARQTDCQLLQSAQRAQWLGQLLLAFPGRTLRRLINRFDRLCDPIHRRLSSAGPLITIGMPATISTT